MGFAVTIRQALITPKKRICTFYVETPWVGSDLAGFEKFEASLVNRR